MSTLPFHTRALLATYPPSFRERYGNEQRALLEDAGTQRTSTDLAVGSVRAWLRPSFGHRGPQWRRQRLLATASTIWVMWVAAFFGGGAWLRGVGDPPVPAMSTHWGSTLSQVATYAYNIGFVSMAVIVAAVFILVANSLRRTHQRRGLLPLAPFALLLTIEVGGLVAISALRWSSFVINSPEYQAPVQWFPWWFNALGALWVLLLIPLMILGATGPVRVLRHSGLGTEVLVIVTRLALLPVVALAVAAAAAAAFVVGEVRTSETAFVLQALASIGLLIVALIALISYARSIDAQRFGTSR